MKYLIYCCHCKDFKTYVDDESDYEECQICCNYFCNKNVIHSCKDIICTRYCGRSAIIITNNVKEVECFLCYAKQELCKICDEKHCHNKKHIQRQQEYNKRTDILYVVMWDNSGGFIHEMRKIEKKGLSKGEYWDMWGNQDYKKDEITVRGFKKKEDASLFLEGIKSYRTFLKKYMFDN